MVSRMLWVRRRAREQADARMVSRLLTRAAPYGNRLLTRAALYRNVKVKFQF